MKYTVLLLATGLLMACSSSKEETKNETPVFVAETMPIVEREPVAEEEPDTYTSPTAVANQTIFNGIMVVPPQRHASVTLTIGGVVKNTSLLPGEYVRKGTVLATLQNHDFIDLQQNYLEAHARTEFLEAEYLRQQTLSQQEAATKKRYQESKAEYLSMKSRMEATAAQLQILGVVPEELLQGGIKPLLEVKAPLSGYITGTRINVGKHINEGESICEIIDKEENLLQLTVYEKDLDGLRPGVPVSFRVNGMGDQDFHATLISVGQEVDAVSRSLNVYARVEESNSRFRPGMYVTAQVERK